MTEWARWRRLQNGLTIERRIGSDWKGYRAVRRGRVVASWSRYTGAGGCGPTGHVNGDFSRVQGTGAPSGELQAWLAEVGQL